MRTSDPVAIHRSDYAPPNYTIPTTALRFQLDSKHTEVTSELAVVRAQGVDSSTPLVLDGIDVELISVSIDDAVVPENTLQQSSTQLTLQQVPATFTLKIVTRIAPDANTALEGLYRSSGNYCTQCEAEGFRKITYFLDRPDVLSVFTVTIEGDAAKLPVMLSNGNPISNTQLPEGKHQWVWHDPHPKPCYLFALVAGELAVVEDSFTTKSGREVLLQIYVQAHNISLCGYGMGALKRSMEWDESVYGLEYDLDRFMIVAVDDFNMGAMENKGLNIFNSKYVLASIETASDLDFIGVEAVIAHEYFHNWTGNRVTCRDWFQLSLKEGLTVFRDQCFTAELHSPPVKRIQDVQLLRDHQFPEDAGPMAHPIRPDSYLEINNFYTTTVYEKGAEVIRMLHTLLGNNAYQAGVALYFQRHDGQAVTCDDFVNAMQDASGIDLCQFRRWYAQSGTPELNVDCHYDADTESYTLTMQQQIPVTPGQPDGQKDKPPLLIPVDVALLDSDGQPIPVTPLGGGQATPGGGVLLQLTDREQRWQFENVTSKPVLSLLRSFSAPVKAHFNYDAQSLAFLMAHDTDTFNRWEAAQRLAQMVVVQLEQGKSDTLETYIQALQQVMQDESIDDALKAQILTPLSYDAVAQSRESIDVHNILDALKQLRVAIAERCHEPLLILLERRPMRTQVDAAILSDAAMAGRALANTALHVMSALPSEHWLSLAEARYRSSVAMTDRMGSLAVISEHPGKIRTDCLAHFHDAFVQHKLVIDKWFALQAAANFDGALQSITELVNHPSFDESNPNRLRSLYGSFAVRNPAQFHARDGAGYRWIADAVLAVDERNPQVAARLVTPLTRWRQFASSSAQQMHEQLQRIADTSSLSRDVFELVSKGLVK